MMHIHLKHLQVYGETVGEGLTGSGMIPGSYYLDLSILQRYSTAYKKNSKALIMLIFTRTFNKTGSMEKLNEVSGQN